MAIDERRLRSLINKADTFVGPGPYAGVSWRNLERYNRHEESGFIMTAEDMPVTQLYAGLAVLSRDIHLYLAKSARKDAAFFRGIIKTVNTEERKRYGATAFPYDDPQFPYQAELKSFPMGLALKAVQGKPTLAPLGNIAIRHEWTVKAGKKLLLEFLRKAGPDPLGLDGKDVNIYAYVSNNPIRWFDPTGEVKKPGLPKRIECLVYRARVEFYCGPSRCEPDDNCLMLTLKIAIKRACITAQTHLTEECYPDDPTHKQRITDALNGIKRCKAFLDAQNCNSCPAK